MPQKRRFRGDGVVFWKHSTTMCLVMGITTLCDPDIIVRIRIGWRFREHLPQMLRIISRARAFKVGVEGKRRIPLD